MLKRRDGKAGFFFTVISVFLTVIIFSAVEAFAADLLLQAAPMNPKFTKYLSDKKAGVPQIMQAKDGHGLGRLPDRIDRSYLRAAAQKERAMRLGAAAQTLPSKYDLRTKGKIGPVKDQGLVGSCWSFAAMASLESTLPKGTAFSENDLLDSHGFDQGPNDGGWDSQSIAYLARWSGPFSESQYPYQYQKIFAPVADTATKTTPVHVQDVYIIPADPTDIKQAIITYGGAAGLAFYYDDSFYHQDSQQNPTIASYYNNYGTDGDTGNGGGHEVAVIGWDDNYPAGNFVQTPPGNGAYLCRNEWGAYWGLGGYFYISYHDVSITGGNFNNIPVLSAASCFYKPSPANTYSRVYQYDPLGETNEVGYGTAGAWMANIFKADKQGPRIKAVSFYVNDLSANYEIKIYDKVSTFVDSNGNYGANVTDGTLVADQSGTAPAGYHTINLKKPVPVTVGDGDNFSVVVHLTDNDGYQYPIAIEDRQAGYSDRACSVPGQSYYSPDGNNWYDVYYADADPSSGYPCRGNVCLKAFGSK